MALRTLFSKKAFTTASGFRPIAAGDRCFLRQARGLTVAALPDLAYDYGALEPAISGEIMRLHHQKHHQAYVTNYNNALEQLETAVAKGDASAVVRLQSAIKFNGGGSPEGGGEPPHSTLGWAIDTDFCSLEALVQKMNAEGAALQGSGWVWLALDKGSKKLSVETTSNQVKSRQLANCFYLQDPLVTKGANLVPLLGIDVWEHAYYLQVHTDLYCYMFTTSYF
ncbi:hypothetical protein GW17_00004540 [Ensete ventricosum]|nr:hypothetical protein GW17_00004540 [Ensete ventricosum]